MNEGAGVDRVDATPEEVRALKERIKTLETELEKAEARAAEAWTHGPDQKPSGPQGFRQVVRELLHGGVAGRDLQEPPPAHSTPVPAANRSAPTRDDWSLDDDPAEDEWFEESTVAALETGRARPEDPGEGMDSRLWSSEDEANKEGPPHFVPAPYPKRRWWGGRR